MKFLPITKKIPLIKKHKSNNVVYKSHYNYFNRFINLNLKNKVTLSEYSLLKKNIIA